MNGLIKEFIGEVLVFPEISTPTCLPFYEHCDFVNAEDILFGDVDKCLHAPDVSPWGFHPNSSYSSSCRYVTDDSAVSSSILTRGGESLPVPEKRLKRTKRSVLVNTCSEPLDTNDCILSFSAGPTIFQGLMLPLYGARLAWKLTGAFWRRFLCHVRRVEAQCRSFVSRVQKTLHGSSSDIGWLQRTAGVPPVEDGTTRFMELLQNIRSGKHDLPNSYVYLLIPGLFSNLSPLYFVSTKRFFSKMGLACHIAKIHSESWDRHITPSMIKPVASWPFGGMGRPCFCQGSWHFIVDHRNGYMAEREFLRIVRRGGFKYERRGLWEQIGSHR